MNNTVKALIYKFFKIEGTLGFDVDMQRYLRRHNVVFLSPQYGGYEGLPVGNGDVSAMVWTEESAIRAQINKSDVWTEPDEEAPMLLRSLGNIRIDFGYPCFAFTSLDNFEARLNIADGTVSYMADTAMMSAKIEIYVDQQSNVIIIDIDKNDKSQNMSTTRLSLDRHGSRAFQGWYHSIARGSEKGAGNTTARCGEDAVYITEKFNGKEKDTPFSLGMSVLGADFTTSIINKNKAEIEIKSGSHLRCTVIVSAASVNDSSDFELEAKNLIVSAKAGIAGLRSRNLSYWKDYWNSSMLMIRGGNNKWEYIENLYYIHMYMVACGSRGRYLMTFNGGTFTWNRDVRQWANPHHWNTHMIYNSTLDSANHSDLVKPYIDTYTRIIPQARELAKSKNVEEGITISEMHDFSGRMLGYLGALTPASQIAMIFWNHYLFTGDRKFLEETAYPFMKLSAEFYLNYAKYNETSGVYEIYPAAVYECDFGENFINTAVDLSAIRSLFPACIAAAKELGYDVEKQKQWENFVESLAPYTYTLNEKGNEVIAVALNVDRTIADFAGQNSTFARNTSPVYPSNIIGIKDKQTRLYKAMVNAIQEYPKHGVAITPTPVVLARLGIRGDKIHEYLSTAVRQLQHFPQGLYYNIDHWSQYSKYTDVQDNGFIRNQRDYIYDRQAEYKNINAGKDKIDMPMEPFIQPGFETPAILAMTLHDVSLQSHEGIIRVFPVEGMDWDSTFTLKARGGFVVSACMKNGEILHAVYIKSLHGNPCNLDTGFLSGSIIIYDADEDRQIDFHTININICCFETSANHRYIIYDDSMENVNLQCGNSVNYEKNNGCKYFYEATIGRKRMF